MIEETTKGFEDIFGASPHAVANAPGRVNLIGEHTDYNDGFALPMAIERRVWAAGRMAGGDKIRLYSANASGNVITVDAGGPIEQLRNWADYPLGVLCELRKEDRDLAPMDVYFRGDVPLGGGLSSSAAIEVATALLAAELNGLSIEPVDMARVCQRAENSFVGMNCGVMDQMASALCVENHALFIDCLDLSYKNVPLDLAGYGVAIVNSGVKRELVDSGYNRRRAECERAAETLGVASLRLLGAGDFPKIEALPLPLNRRVRHVVAENHRVLDSVKHLERGDLREFGRLMKLSHDSLRDDYEVSVPELDYIVEGAMEMDGCLGARLTGAGFGGCVIALVNEKAIEEIEQSLLPAYRDKFEEAPDLIVTAPAHGAGIEKI